jgi:enoyl-CoA hydratase/carnithine racemase
VSDTADVLVQERRGSILVLRLNRPEARNALTFALMAGIGSAVVAAESDPDVRVVVLTGTGDRAFCGGMDLREFAEGSGPPPGSQEGMAAFARVIRGDSVIPLVGAANASAVAGGFELLLACDVIVASSQAQLGLPEVKRGLFAAGGGTLLGTRIPLSVALEMTLTGDNITAERAYALGLVNAVVEPDEVMDSAMTFAERIAANAPLSVAVTKELVRLAVADAERAAARLDEVRPIVWASEDAREGAIAFVERRAPVWKGQ